MKAKTVNKSFSMDNRLCITFEVQDKSILDSVLLDGREVDLTIKPYRQKRSLDANAYMWVLCELLAVNIGITKEEVYKEAIRHMGIFRDIELPVDAAETLQTSWRMLGTGWVTERVDFGESDDTVRIRFYYGSSRYNTKQMSRVIDGLIQDCKAAGIETMTPEELEGLKGYEVNHTK